jgi:hypothetical protein
MVNKIDKLSSNLTTRRREKRQINKIGDEKWDITTNTNEVQRIIKKYFEILYK